MTTSLKEGRRTSALRRLATALAVAGTIAGAGIVAAEPAAAASSCSWGPYDARGSYASCQSGSYRSWTQCSNWLGWYTHYGPVRTSGLSISSCDWGSTRHSYGINTFG